MTYSVKIESHREFDSIIEANKFVEWNKLVQWLEIVPQSVWDNKQKYDEYIDYKLRLIVSIIVLLWYCVAIYLAINAMNILIFFIPPVFPVFILLLFIKDDFNYSWFSKTRYFDKTLEKKKHYT